eukprot:TRINITY_DN3394_c0_g1_i1.p1 TRINITY_DN3394_c0_g1~~TRINITY_DN3394_c0_g1_i1.p1  ORF type:complete len:117 (+),score=46.56 TRINITY_DN3394_c0_g1_i1:104-454(+)
MCIRDRIRLRAKFPAMFRRIGFRVSRAALQEYANHLPKVLKGIYMDRAREIRRGESKKLNNLIGTTSQRSLESKVSSKVQSRIAGLIAQAQQPVICLLYTSPSPRDRTRSRMPSSA